MKTGIAYLFRKYQFEPICSTSIEIPDDADEFKAELIAAHKLMDKDFRIEIMWDSRKDRGDSK